MSEQHAAPTPGPQFTISDDRIYGEALLGGYSLIARVYGDPELAAIFADAPETAAERDRLVAVNENLVDTLILLLPLAKGYAARNRVSINQEICDDAEEILAEARKPEGGGE